MDHNFLDIWLLKNKVVRIRPFTTLHSTHILYTGYPHHVCTTSLLHSHTAKASHMIRNRDRV